jgi:hypothetical protein
MMVKKTSKKNHRGNDGEEDLPNDFGSCVTE